MEPSSAKNYSEDEQKQENAVVQKNPFPRILQKPLPIGKKISNAAETFENTTDQKQIQTINQDNSRERYEIADTSPMFSTTRWIKFTRVVESVSNGPKANE